MKSLPCAHRHVHLHTRVHAAWASKAEAGQQRGLTVTNCEARALGLPGLARTALGRVPGCRRVPSLRAGCAQPPCSAPAQTKTDPGGGGSRGTMTQTGHRCSLL